jgi:uncharacterized protein
MLTISGKHTLQASPEAVWLRVFDPASLALLIPGCQELEMTGPDEYQGTIRIGIAAVGGTYHTEVRITERREMEYCAFEGLLDGPTGAVQGHVSFTLSAQPDRRTELAYNGRAIVSGALGTLGSRLVASVAQTLLKQGFARFDEQLQATKQENDHAHR